MDTTLLLLAKEREVFDALPDALREGWKPEKETMLYFETAKQLQMRFHMSSLRKYPAFKALSEKMEKGEKFTPDSLLSMFDEDMLPEVFFFIGAKGLTFIIQSVLVSAKTDEELQAVAAWSHVRHDLFLSNAAAS